MVRLCRADGEAQSDKIDVQEGMLSRQLCLRRVLRKAEKRDVLRRDWKGVSIDDFMSRLDEYIHWYNKKRIKLSLGGLSPLEYRLKNKENKSIA